MQLTVLSLLFAVTSTFIVTPLTVHPASASTAVMAFRRGKKNQKKTGSPTDAFGETNIEPAVDAVSEILEDGIIEEFDISEPAKAPEINASTKAKPKAPPIDIEDTLVQAARATTGAWKTAVEFEKENELGAKAKDAFAKAVEFEKENELSTKAKDVWSSAIEWWTENEVGLKALAALEVTKEEITKATSTPKKTKKLAQTKQAKKARDTKKGGPFFKI